MLYIHYVGGGGGGELYLQNKDNAVCECLVVLRAS